MNSRPKPNQGRGGFTLVEMLVVVAIIGILAALILPAVNRARETARRTQCKNNLSQLAKAAAAFEGQHNRYPNSGTYGVVVNSGVTSIDFNNPKHSWVVDLLPHLDRQNVHDSWSFLVNRPGVDDDGNNMTNDVLEELSGHPNFYFDPNVQAFHIIGSASGIQGVTGIDAASISQNGLGNGRWSHDVLDFLVCPNDETSLSIGGGLTYVCNSGYAPFDANGNQTLPAPFNQQYWSHFSRTIPWNDNPGVDQDDWKIARRTGVFWAGSQTGRAVDEGRTTSAMISSADGLSSTVMFTENVNGGFLATGHLSHGDFTWGFPWTLATGFVVSVLDLSPVNQVQGPCNLPGVNLYYENANGSTSNFGRINANPGTREGISPFPASFHGDIFNVAMCDSSVRAINTDVDGTVWAKLVSPQGGKQPKGAQVVGSAPNRPDTGLWQSPVSDADY